MVDMITIRGKVTDDGKLVVELPPDAPRGDVEITLRQLASESQQLTPEQEAALDAEFEALMNDPLTFTGGGLSAEEIAQSPVFGIWADREDITDSAAYVEALRRQSRERRMNRED